MRAARDRLNDAMQRVSQAAYANSATAAGGGGHAEPRAGGDQRTAGQSAGDAMDAEYTVVDDEPNRGA